MTNQEILEKAIQKAIDGGWAEGERYLHYMTAVGTLKHINGEPTTATEAAIYAHHEAEIRKVYSRFVIFNHDFAKALWPCEEVNMYHDGLCSWKRKMQEMVVADDPIEYLGANI